MTQLVGVQCPDQSDSGAYASPVKSCFATPGLTVSWHLHRAILIIASIYQVLNMQKALIYIIKPYKRLMHEGNAFIIIFPFHGWLNRGTQLSHSWQMADQASNPGGLDPDTHNCPLHHFQYLVPGFQSRASAHEMSYKGYLCYIWKSLTWQGLPSCPLAQCPELSQVFSWIPENG